jgi:hypothetical protein
MIYTTYDPATGEIQATFSTTDDIMPDNAIPGAYNSGTHYVVNDQAVNKPADPSGIQKYVFDYQTKSWLLDAATSIDSVKKIRDEMLSAVDRVNPVWYASLSPQQQQELITYRQALLDVPQQAGFPGQVEWPAKPGWL